MSFFKIFMLAWTFGWMITLFVVDVLLWKITGPYFDRILLKHHQHLPDDPYLYMLRSASHRRGHLYGAYVGFHFFMHFMPAAKVTSRIYQSFFGNFNIYPYARTRDKIFGCLLVWGLIALVLFVPMTFIGAHFGWLH